MDKLLLHGIKISTQIGVYDWERQQKQTLILDLDIALPHSKAGISDNLQDTIDYAKLVQSLRNHCLQCSFQLLEALAEEIANFAMQHHDIPWIIVRLHKPGILPDVQKVILEIERGQILGA